MTTDRMRPLPSCRSMVERPCGRALPPARTRAGVSESLSPPALLRAALTSLPPTYNERRSGLYCPAVFAAITGDPSELSHVVTALGALAWRVDVIDRRRE